MPDPVLFSAVLRPRCSADQFIRRARLRGARVLIVDADESANESLATALADAGYRVYAASTAVEAFDVAAQFPPDVVVLDDLLSLAEGLDLVTLFRRQPALAAVPFIFLTRSAAEQTGVLPAELDPSRTLPKPVDPARLLQKIEIALAPRLSSTPIST
jgi:DNA-binding response OmpR family regulator